jgi:hypothetical protein
MCYLQYKKQYRLDNHEKLITQNKTWRENNREKLKLLHRKYRKEDINTNKRHQIYYHRDINKSREYQRNWYYKNRQSNIKYCISRNMSQSIRHSLKTGKHHIHWEKLVNYTSEQLKLHIEAQFKPGMNWDNYGFRGWHIDHIVPISSFNITSCECDEFKKCWALSNLQPLWWYENLSKGNRF